LDRRIGVSTAGTAGQRGAGARSVGACLRSHRQRGPSGVRRLGRPPRAHPLAAAVRSCLRAESGSAGVLVGAIVVALVWANVDTASYDAVWHTTLSIRLGGFGLGRGLRDMVPRRG